MSAFTMRCGRCGSLVMSGPSATPDDARQLALELWAFIEHVSEEDPTRHDQFFALRSRFREVMWAEAGK